MIIHSVECLSMPSAFRDWDMDNGSVEDHKCRHKKVLLEMLLTIFVRFIIHAIMLVPVIFTGKNYSSCSKSNEWNSLAMKIWERHGFLEVTVGYFPEELAAYEIATTMVRIVVFLFPVLTFLEFLLYWTYQQWVILFEPLYGSVIPNFCFVSILVSSLAWNSPGEQVFWIFTGVQVMLLYLQSSDSCEHWNVNILL